MNQVFPEELIKRIFESQSFSLQWMKTVFETLSREMPSDMDKKEADRIFEKIARDVMDLYQNFVGRYLNAPQPGVPNEMFQNLLKAMDAHYRFSILAGEFSIKLSKPLLESMKSIQEMLREKEDPETGREASQTAYDRLIGILEKTYDDYLKSREGIADVARVVEAHTAYKSRIHAAGEAWCRTLGIPTRSELNAISRTVYELRKQNRELSRRLDGISRSLSNQRGCQKSTKSALEIKNRIKSSGSQDVVSGDHKAS
jgi:class III poly(R)-hydroxyalkanoic acid synthase PhaE subunit